MSIFKNKKIWTKLICVLLLIMVFQFVAPEPVEASEGWGILLDPITSLVLALADGVNSILHTYIAGNDTALISVDFSQTWWDQWGTLVIAIAIVVVVTVITAGVRRSCSC